MPRRRKGELLDNEKRVAMAALRLWNLSDDRRFWVADVADALEAIGERSLNDATINRALNRFLAEGWMSAAWGTADPDDPSSSRPRMYFAFTPRGERWVRTLLRHERERQPAWLLNPRTALGERDQLDARVVSVRGRRTPHGRARTARRKTAS